MMGCDRLSQLLSLNTRETIIKTEKPGMCARLYFSLYETEQKGAIKERKLPEYNRWLQSRECHLFYDSEHENHTAYWVLYERW